MRIDLRLVDLGTRQWEKKQSEQLVKLAAEKDLKLRTFLSYLEETIPVIAIPRRIEVRFTLGSVSGFIVQKVDLSVGV